MQPEAKIKGNVKQAVPFFRVTDIQQSVRYYVDGLGFNITNQWVDQGKLRWCWLERGGAGLMLQEFWQEGPHANVPTDKVGVGVTICFICEDALALYHEFNSRGIHASKPYVGNSMWVTSVTDPDGYVLDFESYTDTPEDTEYSDQEQ